MGSGIPSYNESSSSLEEIDWETAKLLDESLVPIQDDLILQVLPDRPLPEAQHTNATSTNDRIAHDLQLLVSTMASSLDTVDQWRQVVQECRDSLLTSPKALRDLCAQSPELAAVVTDGILRANTKLDLLPQWCQTLQQPFVQKLYITQLLLAMVVASDDAVHAIRTTPGLPQAIQSLSSYAHRPWRKAVPKSTTELQRAANQLLAAIGVNLWSPKTKGQKGLRILCLDGGGSRGMTAVTVVRCLVDACNGTEVSDSFDLIAGTSTGGIIAFLTALRRETSAQAQERYNQLIQQIFVKSALSTPLMFFTTATYDESPFMSILSNILGDNNMLDSRADPTVPYVFCVTSKMSSTPTHVALFRNYNYGSGERPDPFVVDPDRAREELGLLLEMEHPVIQSGNYPRRKSPNVQFPGSRWWSEGSRHPGSFRVLQRYALRASTAAPTVFKPVMMGGEMYCDGGIVASNPTAVAIHEARTLFPDVPIEMVVSVGTGGFYEQKSPPRIGWDGIIGQIVNSATDGEQIHHVLEDILGDSSIVGSGSQLAKTRYFRFNPVIGMPDEFPIDVTDPDKLARLRQITRAYMDEPEQRAKTSEIAAMLKGKHRKRRWQFWR